LKLRTTVLLVLAGTSAIAVGASFAGARGPLAAAAMAIAATAHRRIAGTIGRLVRHAERAAHGEPFEAERSGIAELDALSGAIEAIAEQVAREREAMRRHAESATAIAHATDRAEIARLGLEGLAHALDAPAGALWVVPEPGVLARAAALGMRLDDVPEGGEDAARAGLDGGGPRHLAGRPSFFEEAGVDVPDGVLVVPIAGSGEPCAVAVLAARPVEPGSRVEAELTRATMRATLALQSALARERSTALVKKLEERHAELEDRKAVLEAVLGALDDPIVMHDAEGRVQLANAAAERLAGVPPIGLTMDVISAAIQLRKLDDSPVEDGERARAALLAGGRLTGALHRYTNPVTGVTRIVGLDAVPVMRDGALVAGVVHAHDVTDEHELRLELETANRRLRAQNAELVLHEAELEEKSRAVSARELVLQKQNEELERGSQLKSDFLASMSHELRTPLNAVIGFAELLRAGTTDPLTPAQAEHVGNIVDAGQSLLSLINDILDLSKIEAGRMDIVPTRIDLAGPIAQAEALVSHAARGKGLELRSNVREGDLVVFADRDRVRQIAINLLSNAVKFTPEGGRVVVEAAVEGGFAVVRVTDTGIGIAPERAVLLFQPFVQLEGGYARRFPGTGLGLSISKRLVEMMGGAIGFSSQPGSGSTFYFTLPLAERVTPAAGLPRGSTAPIERSDPDPPSTRTIVPGAPARTASMMPASPAVAPLVALVVDDDQMNRRVVESMLEPTGCVVVEAKSGLEALTLASKRAFDVVLLDIGMPDITGLEVTKTLRADPKTAALPVIAVSAHARPADVAEAERAGCNGFVAKPIARMKLYEAIDRAVGDTRWRRARR
jgi:signal transduction histidine kinase/ActR/RegA family two-component response regulator